MQRSFFTSMLFLPDKGVLFLQDHLERLQKGIFVLKGSKNDFLKMQQDLAIFLNGLTNASKVRIHVDLEKDAVVFRFDASTVSHYFGMVQNLCVKTMLDCRDVERISKEHKKISYQKEHDWMANLPDGFQDIIYLDKNDNVIEASYSNIIVMNAKGELFTPRINERIYPGVTLQKLKTFIPVREEQIPLASLYNASGIYLLSSVRGIVRVRKVNQTSIITNPTLEEWIERFHQEGEKLYGRP